MGSSASESRLLHDSLMISAERNYSKVINRCPSVEKVKFAKSSAEFAGGGSVGGTTDGCGSVGTIND